MSIFSERVQVPPFGIFGGHSALPARYIITRTDGKKEHVEYKTSRIKLYEGDTFTILTPGGGGYGNALERDPELVLEDYIDQKVSLEDAQKYYGVVIDPKTNRINRVETKKLREDAKPHYEMIARNILAGGYRVGLPGSYMDKGISTGDLVEISTGSIPLRGWVMFQNDLRDRDVGLSKIFFDTLKLSPGDVVLLRRVGRGLAASTLTEG
jgi:hypothetical protein